MTWGLQEVALLARDGCRECGGLGMLEQNADFPGKELCPCWCVCHRIFDACYARYRSIMDGSRSKSPVTVSARHGGASRPFEEYVADFTLVSRRVLRGQVLWTELFNKHILWQMPLPRLAAKLCITTGAAESALRDMKYFLGRTYKELKPYALFPLYEYFAQGALSVEEYDSNPFRNQKHTKLGHGPEV